MPASRFKARSNYETPPGEKPGVLVRTYRLRIPTVRRIDGLCAERGWYPSDLVQLLLDEGLNRLQSGDLRITERPVMFQIGIENPEE